MTIHKPANTVWSWLRLVAEAAIAIVWVITIVSVLSGDWPNPTRWFLLLSVTGMAVGGRIRLAHPKISDYLVLVATVTAVVAVVVSLK